MTNPDNSIVGAASKATRTRSPNAGPQGFQPLTDAEVIAEARLAMLNDRGDENTKLNAHVFLNGRQVVHGYTVSEERQNPFTGNNSSIQSVAFGNGRNDVAQLMSVRDGSINMLTGTSDGRVTISSLREGVSATIDITQAAAAAGITAAGIRRTQHDIAADGEVSRPEQTTIINMVNTAKRLAGIR